jgi:hypothetical protein
MTIAVRVGVAITAAILGGCAGVKPASSPMTPPVTTSESIVERSYTIGQEQRAFVGGTIGRVKEYRLDKTSRQGALHASRDFTLFYPLLGPRVLVRTTDPIPIVGTTERDGQTYRLVALPQVPLVKLLIADDGRFEGSGLGLGNARMGYTYSPSPPDVTLRLDTSTTTVSSAGYLNYELVYSGATKDSIRLLYREYTRDDLIRPAFTQDLVYERGAPTIRFRNTLIRVIEATGEHIRYVVAEDDYPPAGP